MWDKLRKFGMEYCDLPTMLWNVAFMLRALTLNIDSRNKKGISVFTYIWTVTTSAMYYYVYLISMAWFVFWKTRETGDVFSGIVVFSLGLSSEIGMTKLMFMLYYQSDVRKIVDGYLACDALTDSSTRFARNVMKTLRVVKKRALIFWAVIIGNGVVYVAKAIIRPGRHFMEDAFVFYGLEPMFESPNYEIAFVLNVAGVYVTCYVPANITAFLIIVTGYTEAQMIALSEELTHLWEDAENNQDSNIDTSIDMEPEIENSNKNVNETINNYIKHHLEDIVKRHTTNINLLHQLEDVFRGAIAVEFMLLIAGLIAELLGGLEKTYIQLPFALMLVGADCLVGQRVMDAGEMFKDAIYNSKWENFDVRNRRIVLLMLQNSQKVMRLSAGGITTLSFMANTMWKFLSKFGLEHCDLPTMLWNVSFILRALTINIDRRNKKRIPFLFYISTSIMALCNFYVYTVSALWLVFWRCWELPSCDMLMAVFNFSMFVACNHSVAKLIFIYFSQSTLTKLFDGYLASNARSTPGSRFSNNLLKTLRNVKKRAIVLWVMIMMNGLLYLIRPLFRSGTHLLEDLQVLIGLEPMLESPNFELSYLIITSGVIFICYVASSTLALFIVMIGYIEAQMLALSEELVHLWANAQKHYDETYKIEDLHIDNGLKTKIDNKYINNRLIDIVESHTTNLRFQYQLENVFRGAIAMEFTLLSIGLIAELLCGLENTYMEVPFTLVGAATDCWTGQKLIDACVTFEKAVYDCKWENFDYTNMKIVLLLLRNSQKHMKLSAGGIATLSLSCLMSVIRSVYSAYTALYSTVK